MLSMNKTRMITVLCVLLAVVFALTGCTTFNNFKEAFIDPPDTRTDTIDIGVYEPMTGPSKEDAKAELSGIELAHDAMPEIDGREVRLIYADTSSTIEAAETAINTLIAKKPSVILGSYGALFSLTAGEHIAEAQIPSIAITNTNPLVTRNNSFYFRVCYVDASQGRLLAHYLNSIGEKSAGILLPSKDDAATAMATAFTNELSTLTDNDDAIAFHEEYTTGDTNFTRVLRKLKNADVKSVLLPGDMNDAASIIRQANDMGLQIRFLGPTNWGSEEFLTAISTNSDSTPATPIDPDHLAFVQFFASDGTDDTDDTISEAREMFLDAYHKKYGKKQDPEDAVALGYDAYGIAIDAVLKAEELEATAPEATAAADATDAEDADAEDAADSRPSGEAIRSVLADSTYEFDGASGVIRFNKRGDPKKTAFISTWNQGAITSIYTIEADEQ